MARWHKVPLKAPPVSGDSGPGWLCPSSLRACEPQTFRPQLSPLWHPQLSWGNRPLRGHLGLVSLQAGRWVTLRPAWDTEDSLCPPGADKDMCADVNSAHVPTRTCGL